MNSEIYNGPTIALVRAMQEYRATGAHELSLVPGQVYHVKEKQENGMWLGLSTAGQKGAFPGNLTEEVANLGLTRQSRAATVPLPGVQPMNFVTSTKETSSRPSFLNKFMKERGSKSKGNLTISEPSFSYEVGESSSRSTENVTSSPSITASSSAYSISNINTPPAYNHSPVIQNAAKEEEIYEEFYVRTKQAYQAKNPAHLSFNAGDFILVKEELPTGWWKGELVGYSKNGLFMSSLVEVVDASEVRYPSKIPQAAVQPTLQAPPAQESQGSEDIEDEYDDLPTVVPRMVKYGGNSNNASPAQTRQDRSASLPAYSTAALPPPMLPPVAQMKKFRAVFPFSAQKDGQLSFRKGDEVFVKDQGTNWWSGIVDGREGLFPATYVREVDRVTPMEEQLDKMHARYVASVTKYEQQIKELTTKMESMQKRSIMSSP